MCVCVCVLFLAARGGPASRARSCAPHLLLWPVLLLCSFFFALSGLFVPFLWLLPCAFFPICTPGVSSILSFPAQGALGPGVLSFPSPPPTAPPHPPFFSFFSTLSSPLALVSGPCRRWPLPPLSSFSSPPPVCCLFFLFSGFFCCLFLFFFRVLQCHVLPCCASCAALRWFACPELWGVSVRFAVGGCPGGAGLHLCCAFWCALGVPFLCGVLLPVLLCAVWLRRAGRVSFPRLPPCAGAASGPLLVFAWCLCWAAVLASCCPGRCCAESCCACFSCTPLSCAVVFSAVYFGVDPCLSVVLRAVSVCVVACRGASCCSAWLCCIALLCWFVLRCAVWCAVVPWCVLWFCAVLFVSLRCSCRVMPRPLLWRAVVLCLGAQCCVAQLYRLWSWSCCSLCRVSWRVSFRGASCVVLCWRACVVAFCVVLSCPSGAGWFHVLLPIVFGCLLLGLVVHCCVLVAPGGLFQQCCPGLASRLVALWFGVVCCGALPPCVVSCGAVITYGGVMSCSAVCLRCCLCLLSFFSFENPLPVRPVRMIFLSIFLKKKLYTSHAPTRSKTMNPFGNLHATPVHTRRRMHIT